MYLDCLCLMLFVSSNLDLWTGYTNENSKFSKFRQLKLFINRSWTINIAFLKAHPNMTMKVNGFTLIKLEYSRFKCCIMSNFWFYYRCICTIFFQWTAKMGCSNICSHKKLSSTYKLEIKSKGSWFGSAYGVAQHRFSCSFAKLMWLRR